MTGCNGNSFNEKECYDDNLNNLDNRMPLSIDNLISLLEKYERIHSPPSIENLARGIVRR